MLGFVNHFFVQDERSDMLLQELGFSNVTVSGDTRFDRVWGNVQHPKPIPQIGEFKNGGKIFIAGSTWPQDEKLVAALVKEYPAWKFIIAPHEISEEKIKKLMGLLPLHSAVRYSQLSAQHALLPIHQTIVIDNIGMLSSLYQYGDIAYIGGGFGAGIHNTLEAAAFGLPVIFGPNYSKFKEARDLIAIKAGFTIADEAQLKAIADMLINNSWYYTNTSKKIKTFVEEHRGATGKIMEYLKSINQPVTAANKA
jgi:3-deoxy-D-manno-octulosonic-acid transferase